MIYIKQDTNKINECGKEIISLANDYEKVITKIFERVNNIDDAWVGEDATLFVNKLKEEEATYINFGNLLKQYGQTLTEVSNEVKNTLKNTDINK